MSRGVGDDGLMFWTATAGQSVTCVRTGFVDHLLDHFKVVGDARTRYQRACTYVLTLNAHVTFRDWELFLHRFGPFNSCLKRATDSFFNGPKLELVPWFHGPISRARAQTVLHTGPKGGSPGHFLVRFSEKCPEYFTLSYLAPAPTGTVMRNVLVYNLGERGYSVYQTASAERCFATFKSFVTANGAKLAHPCTSLLYTQCKVAIEREDAQRAPAGAVPGYDAYDDDDFVVGDPGATAAGFGAGAGAGAGRDAFAAGSPYSAATGEVAGGNNEEEYGSLVAPPPLPQHRQPKPQPHDYSKVDERSGATHRPPAPQRHDYRTTEDAAASNYSVLPASFEGGGGGGGPGARAPAAAPAPAAGSSTYSALPAGSITATGGADGGGGNYAPVSASLFAASSGPQSAGGASNYATLSAAMVAPAAAPGGNYSTISAAAVAAADGGARPNPYDAAPEAFFASGGARVNAAPAGRQVAAGGSSNYASVPASFFREPGRPSVGAGGAQGPVGGNYAVVADSMFSERGGGRGGPGAAAASNYAVVDEGGFADGGGGGGGSGGGGNNYAAVPESFFSPSGGGGGNADGGGGGGGSSAGGGGAESNYGTVPDSFFSGGGGGGTGGGGTGGGGGGGGGADRGGGAAGNYGAIPESFFLAKGPGGAAPASQPTGAGSNYATVPDSFFAGGGGGAAAAGAPAGASNYGLVPESFFASGGGDRGRLAYGEVPASRFSGAGGGGAESGQPNITPLGQSFHMDRSGGGAAGDSKENGKETAAEVAAKLGVDGEAYGNVEGFEDLSLANNNDDDDGLDDGKPRSPQAALSAAVIYNMADGSRVASEARMAQGARAGYNFADPKSMVRADSLGSLPASERVAHVDRALQAGSDACMLGNFPEAQKCFEVAASLSHSSGTKVQLARALANLGSVLARQGMHAVAADKFGAALKALKQLGDKDKEVRVLGAATASCMAAERYADALQHAARHVTLVSGQPEKVAAVAAQIREIKERMRK